MKTSIILFISKTKGVWNTVGYICGLKRTHFIEQENLKYGAVVFHTPPPDIYYNNYISRVFYSAFSFSALLSIKK